jgi:hypothetical protein
MIGQVNPRLQFRYEIPAVGRLQTFGAFDRELRSCGPAANQIHLTHATLAQGPLHYPVTGAVENG